MNKLFLFTLLSAVTIAFTSCLKNNNDNQPEVPSAGLMAFNLAPDQQSVAIRLSGNNLTQSPLAFTNFTGMYQGIYVGDREVQSFDYPETTPLSSVNYSFEQDKYYSLFVVGANGNYANVISNDNLDSLQRGTGNAYVRYVNAIPDSASNATVAISAGGGEVISEPADFKKISAFSQVAPGDVTITAKNSGTLDISRTFAVQQNKIYTVLLVGMPGATDDNKKPQIKYIENGTLADSTTQN